MKPSRPTRRSLLKTGTLATAGLLVGTNRDASAAEAQSVTIEHLDRTLAQPVLKLDALTEPVTVASIEVLKNGKNYLLRTRSTAGVEAITVPNPTRMAETYPIFLKHIAPVFLKKDA